MAFEAPFAWHPCQGAARSTRSSGGLRSARPPAIGLQPFRLPVPSRAPMVPPSHNLWNSPHEILRAARKYKLFALRIRVPTYIGIQIDPRGVHPRVSAVLQNARGCPGPPALKSNYVDYPNASPLASMASTGYARAQRRPDWRRPAQTGT